MEVLRVFRDVAIIILAVETIVIGLAVLFLVWQAWKLVGLARRHLETIGSSATGILSTAQDTARTTKGTAGFVADRTARPVIEFYSAINGASRFARAVFRPKGSPAESESPNRARPNREGERDE